MCFEWKMYRSASSMISHEQSKWVSLCPCQSVLCISTHIYTKCTPNYNHLNWNGQKVISPQIGMISLYIVYIWMYTSIQSAWLEIISNGRWHASKSSKKILHFLYHVYILIKSIMNWVAFSSTVSAMLHDIQLMACMLLLWTNYCSGWQFVKYIS
jgi:hypothetical protein